MLKYTRERAARKIAEKSGLFFWSLQFVIFYFDRMGAGIYDFSIKIWIPGGVFSGFWGKMGPFLAQIWDRIPKKIRIFR